MERKPEQPEINIKFLTAEEFIKAIQSQKLSHELENYEPKTTIEAEPERLDLNENEEL